MYAIILAGGKGGRLLPYTIDIPKPMVRVGCKPIISYQIKQFKDAGIRDIILTENYKASVIQDYFKDGFGFGVSITHLVDEKEGIGTTGVVKKALSLVPEGENVVVTCGDVISDVNLKDLVSKHKVTGRPMTLWIREYTLPLGVPNINSEGIIENFKEKPQFNVNTSVCVVNQNIRNLLPDKGDFYADTGKLFEGNITAYKSAGEWLHITDPGDLYNANKEVWERILGIKEIGRYGIERY